MSATATELPVIPDWHEAEKDRIIVPIYTWLNNMRLGDYSYEFLHDEPHASAGSVISSEKPHFVFNTCLTRDFTNLEMLALTGHEAHHARLWQARAETEREQRRDLRLLATERNRDQAAHKAVKGESAPWHMYAISGLVGFSPILLAVLIFVLFSAPTIISNAILPLCMALVIITLPYRMHHMLNYERSHAYAILHDEEYECDAYGAKVAAPEAMIAILMQQEPATNWLTRLDRWVGHHQHGRTHPSTASRVKRLRAMTDIDRGDIACGLLMYRNMLAKDMDQAA